MPTVQSVLRALCAQFREAGIESADLDARLLARHVLGVSREDLILKSNEEITAPQESALRDFAARRLKREPVSRIVGQKPFWKSDFKISKETLDPRPDSETLIEAALRHAQDPQRVLDLGTGSGCLLLSLLQEWPRARGVGVDISAAAIETAGENAAALGLAGRAAFVAGDWAEYRPETPFDVVISNPPYIGEGEKGGLAPEVALFDPPQALFAGEGGLGAYRVIIPLLKGFLAPGGHAFFEIGHAQGPAVKDMLEQAGFSVLETATDLAGSDRCIVARR